jgi:DNA-binding HxlR family transcriptional regulator
VTYLDETITDYQADRMKRKSEEFSVLELCPIRNVLDRFGDKWSILVILILGQHEKPMRFTELMNGIGNVSQKMLTVTLRTLESDGLLLRKHYPEIPPRVEYELTEMGQSLMPHINGMVSWADKHFDAIMKARKKSAAKKQLA